MIDLSVLSIRKGRRPHEIYEALAHGYLSAAILLTETLNEDEDFQRPAFAASISFLIAHSVELFLKEGLALAGEAIPQGHDIDALAAAWRRAYPALADELEIPFEFRDADPEFDLDVAPPSIRLRYGDDGQGRPRDQLDFDLVDPEALREDLDELEDLYSRLRLGTKAVRGSH